MTKPFYDRLKNYYLEVGKVLRTESHSGGFEW
jgi:hypothetical protein